MSYERKCLCCQRKRERRHFFPVNDNGEHRLSIVCTDCVTGRTPRRFLPSNIPAGDGLWVVPVSPPAEFRSLASRP